MILYFSKGTHHKLWLIPRRIGFCAFLILTAPNASGADCIASKPVPVGQPESQTLVTPRAPQSGRAWTAGRIFDRVITVVFENQDQATVMAYPYFAALAKQGANFTHVTGLFHPSYSNYLAMIAGKYLGAKGDEQKDISSAERTIDGLLEGEGVSWTAYAERYPGRCYLGGASPNDLYQRKHVPFLSFKSITGDMGRCAKVLRLSQFRQSTLAEYVFVTPDMCNDGHDACGDQKPLDRSAKWPHAFLEQMIADQAFMKRPLIMVTFDESERYDHNHIYTVFLGGMVKPEVYSSCTDHYNVLRTIEDNFGLGTLNAEDENSSPLTSVWKLLP